MGHVQGGATAERRGPVPLLPLAGPQTEAEGAPGRRRPSQRDPWVGTVRLDGDDRVEVGAEDQGRQAGAGGGEGLLRQGCSAVGERDGVGEERGEEGAQGG